MKYEDFKNRMEQIESFLKEADEFNSHVKAISQGGFSEIGFTLLNNFIFLLEEQFKSSFNWIDYYIWECEMGKSPMKVILQNKEEILLDSVKKLYYILTIDENM